MIFPLTDLKRIFKYFSEICLLEGKKINIVIWMKVTGETFSFKKRKEPKKQDIISI